jgi:Fe-S oxidoreductase
MLKEFLEKILPGNTLYYPGCITKFAAPEIEENYKKLLNKLGINFIVMPEFVCCGSPVLNAGYEKDFEELKKKNLELFKKYNVKKIITSCPGCYQFFRFFYGVNVEHFTQTLAKRLSKLPVTKKGPITYHDPCHLGRAGKVYDEPRDILRHIGYTVAEMKDNKERALCCGAGGGLKSNNPALAKQIALARLNQVATDSIVTPCTMCYLHMKENAMAVKVYEMSEVLL